MYWNKKETTDTDTVQGPATETKPQVSEQETTDTDTVQGPVT